MPFTPAEEETLKSQVKQLNIYKSKREKLFTQVQRSYDLISQADETNIMQHKPRYDKLLDFEKQLDTIQDLILQLNADLIDPTQALEVCQVQNAFDDLIFAARGRFLALTKTTSTVSDDDNNPSAVASTSNNANNYLPRISLPIFTGRIDEWTAFYSLFDSVVHNSTSLTDSEKFQYLRSYLRGDALAVISNYHLTPENYLLAYKALQLRYQNKRRLASHYFHQIRDFTPLTSATHASLRQFLNVHSNSVSALKALKLTDLGDFLLFQLSFLNLDPSTRKAFENKQNTNSIPSYQALIDFVTEQSRTYEMLFQDTKPKSKSPSIKSASLLSNMRSSESPSQHNGYCALCKGQHSLTICNEFLQKSIDAKYDILKKLKRCFNCLGAHPRNECRSKKTCRTCHSNRHHSVLHQDTAINTEPSINENNHHQDTVSSVDSPTTSSSLVLSSHVSDDKGVVLLATVQFLIQDTNNSWHLIRAVVDPGSQISIITSSLAQNLALKRVKSPFEIMGISNTSVKTQGIVRCLIRPKNNAQYDFAVNAVVISNIPNQFPSQTIPAEICQQFENLPLADNNFYKPSRVDFLIGADLYPHILSESRPNIIQGTPSAINTVFGWIIMGHTSKTDPPNVTQILYTSVEPIESILQKFWKIEEINNETISNPDDDFCEEHFIQTHYRTPTGRYVVSMPFRKQSVSLTDNRSTTLRSYYNLEKRLLARPSINDAYNRFLQEYLNCGHMSIASRPSNYVVPHHCVTKEDSSTTKIRVVFNGSSPDSHGHSLNKQLLPGPKLQKDLSHILTNFRLHDVAITADIKMMYRQILLHPEQRHLQHIFWRPNPNADVVEYELNTVTYGLTPSAFLAQRVLIQLVRDEGQHYPLAARALTFSTYVDDIVTGASSIEEAKSLKSQLINLLNRGGFQLRKWASNCLEVLSDVPEEHLESTLCFSDQDYGIKILGLIWEPRSDSFAYNVGNFSSSVTKRSVLSYIARIFDPMGWLAPILFWTKHFLQQIWIAHIGWDDTLPPSLISQWENFIAQITVLRVLRIPRHIPHADSTLRLVGFCDASEKGFAAAVYLHVLSPDAGCFSYLLKAKSKVAPLKTLSIPRLELCGAWLLARLIKDVSNCFTNLAFDSIHLYTDSQTVLTWINTPPHTLKTFVANRVVQILEYTFPEQWIYVPSEDNPADYASRGMQPKEIIDNHVWWHGPSFLKYPSSSWPNARLLIDSVNQAIPEVKPTPVALHTQVSDDHFQEVISRFSSLTKLQRTVAYVLRFLRSRKTSQKGPLTCQELRQALQLCVRMTQRKYYADLYEELQDNEHTNSTLRKLSPFIVSSGLLRVGGRLRNSSLSYSSKYPLLLPKEAHISKLICDYYHLYSLHSGPRTVQAIIQQNFWILSLRSLLRQRIHQCIRCFRFKSKIQQPYMADLPQARVRLNRPFTAVGMDFAGPFTIRESRRRKSYTYKGYLCLFVCMATKALHLEMVTELSTKAFLACLHRFTSRRGLPSQIYSDCGRNFVGAARQLDDLSHFLKQHSEEIFTSLASLQIEWHFNPPSAPNFGGLWEAGVKSTKTLLYRLVGNISLTFEEYSTLFSKIEAVLNSRPLCALASSPEDASDYLTPGHFLIGSSLLQPPEEMIRETMTPTCRWKHLQQIYQTFWKRWSTEYLHTQIQRQKWNRATPNIKEGSVVLLRDINTSPLSWPIGRVQEVHPGPDGIVRVVTIKLSSGLYTRPVNKLLILPVM